MYTILENCKQGCFFIAVQGLLYVLDVHQQHILLSKSSSKSATLHFA
jgi:hypothetical protein